MTGPNPITFYHYLPSGDYVFDGPEGNSDEATGEVAIKTLHLQDVIRDDLHVEDEPDEDSLHETFMSELYKPELEDPEELVWTCTKYTPKEVGQLIALWKNDGLKIIEAARIARIGDSAAYSFIRQYKKNGDILPGYKRVSEVKKNMKNQKLNEEHSQFLEDYVEQNPTCIIRDATAALCNAFRGLTIHESTVYRHITEKLSISLTRTQPRVADRNSEDTRESRRQF
ncbi:hypothetical protein DM01DRAFT_1284262, partial [Hesseltinella vesiculosa]